VRIRHANTDLAFAKKQQLNEGEGINAGMGQRAVFIEIRAVGHKVGARKLAELRGDGLGVLLRGHWLCGSAEELRPVAAAKERRSSGKSGRHSKPAVAKAGEQ
jgi:hypothetical protein